MYDISVVSLLGFLTASEPLLLIDVRKQGARTASGVTIQNSIWRDPALWLDWKDEVAAMPGHLVFFCVHGKEISQGLTAALNAMGRPANYLQGGFAEWQTANLKVVPIALDNDSKG